MAGCHCSLGVCAGTAYTFAVWFGCFAFILWGCHCDDPEHGYPNDWNRIYIAKEKLTDTGYYVHKCDLVGFAALFGLEWCIAIGASVSANLYISLPVLAFLVYYYGWRVAAKSLLLAVLAAAGLVAMLFLAVDGLDPPPGFGISGVPLGGCVVAGCASVLCHFLLAGYGFRKNENLGIFMQRAAVYTITSVGAGVVVSFYFHVAIGLMIPLVLLSAAGFSTQVFLVEGAGPWMYLAFVSPLLLGGATSVALEMSGLSMPELVGTAIGLAFAFMVIAPLSWFYESRGVAGAVGVAGFALLQDTIFVATIVAGDKLSVASGAALAVALETIAATTVWVWVKVGSDFGLFTLGYEMLVLLGFTPVLVCAASPSLPPPGAPPTFGGLPGSRLATATAVPTFTPCSDMHISAQPPPPVPPLPHGWPQVRTGLWLAALAPHRVRDCDRRGAGGERGNGARWDGHRAARGLRDVPHRAAGELAAPPPSPLRRPVAGHCFPLTHHRLHRCAPSPRAPHRARQANLVLLGIVTFGLPAELTTAVNVGCYVGLLITLLAGLRYDDGAGRLYGSGVEVLYFVCAALFVGTGTTAGLYLLTAVDDNSSQLAGVTFGCVMLLGPVIARALGNKKTPRYSAKVGLRVSVLLVVCSGADIVLVHGVNDVSIKETVQWVAAYNLTYLLLMGLAIERFKVALVVTYLLWLASAAASIALASLYDMNWFMLNTLLAVSAVASTGELCIVRGMALDRIAARDDRRLHAIHLADVASRQNRQDIRTTKPKEPKAKRAPGGGSNRGLADGRRPCRARASGPVCRDRRREGDAHQRQGTAADHVEAHVQRRPRALWRARCTLQLTAPLRPRRHPRLRPPSRHLGPADSPSPPPPPRVSGVLEWCEADGTRPTLPFKCNLFVARGSFYYLFPPSGARMPTDRALGAWLLYDARCAMHPSFSHPQLGPALENLLFVHLSVPWGKAGKNFFLKFKSRRKMEEWHVGRRYAQTPDAPFGAPEVKRLLTLVRASCRDRPTFSGARRRSRPPPSSGARCAAVRAHQTPRCRPGTSCCERTSSSRASR